ncbi:transposase [Geotalea uraniireducens]|uniref:transposase n=1 Tax=Geotalea uraniireducens TaxID=351604 RepID=UPI0002D906AF|nr:transposase [Geotalea uraniireducens]
MEATIFTGWIYDFLTPYAVDLKVAHPEMLKAITAAKKKNDRADAEMIADLLRVNLLPECHMLSEEIRELRRILRIPGRIPGTPYAITCQDFSTVSHCPTPTVSNTIVCTIYSSHPYSHFLTSIIVYLYSLV